MEHNMQESKPIMGVLQYSRGAKMGAGSLRFSREAALALGSNGSHISARPTDATKAKHLDWESRKHNNPRFMPVVNDLTRAVRMEPIPKKAKGSTALIVDDGAEDLPYRMLVDGPFWKGTSTVEIPFEIHGGVLEFTFPSDDQLSTPRRTKRKTKAEKAALAAAKAAQEEINKMGDKPLFPPPLPHESTRSVPKQGELPLAGAAPVHDPKKDVMDAWAMFQEEAAAYAQHRGGGNWSLIFGDGASVDFDPSTSKVGFKAAPPPPPPPPELEVFG